MASGRSCPVSPWETVDCQQSRRRGGFSGTALDFGTLANTQCERRLSSNEIVPEPTLIADAGQHTVVLGARCVVTCATCWACTVQIGMDPVGAAPRARRKAEMPVSRGFVLAPALATTDSRLCQSARSTSQLDLWMRLSSSRRSLAASSATRRSVGTSSELTYRSSDRIWRMAMPGRIPMPG